MVKSISGWCIEYERPCEIAVRYLAARRNLGDVRDGVRRYKKCDFECSGHMECWEFQEGSCPIYINAPDEIIMKG